MILAGTAGFGIAACVDSVAGTIWVADGIGRWLTSSVALVGATLLPRLTCSVADGFV